MITSAFTFALVIVCNESLRLFGTTSLVTSPPPRGLTTCALSTRYDISCLYFKQHMSLDITLINGDYYEVIDNHDCNAPDDYILVELGPHHSWDEITRYEDWDDDSIPF